jgi:hypothetical protein
MALRALRTVTNETSAFESAKARWERVSAERRALRDKLDGAKAALVFADYRPGPGEYLSPTIEDKARRYLDGRAPDRDRLTRQIVDLEYELNEAAAIYSIESTAWKLALENEARRRAEALRPRHRAAVKRMAKAVEELSAAVEAERAVRGELAEVGSAALPDASREFGTLHEYSSLLSGWNRRLLAEGAFDR